MQSSAPVDSAAIVIPVAATEAERTGAEELALHLRQVTGGRFPIVTDATPAHGFEIRVGATARTANAANALAEQEYVVDIRRDAIELVGAGEATLYAVYDFLERDVGVKWIDPTDFGTVIPKRTSLDFSPGRRVRAPFARTRRGTWGDDAYHTAFCDRDGATGRYYYRLGYGTSSEAEVRMKMARFLRRHRVGGRREVPCHSFYGWYDRFLNRESPKFEAYHPEYFAQGAVDEKGRPAQLCYSNPAVLAQVVREARASGGDTFCVEPMDNSSFCTCATCRVQYEPDRTPDHSKHSTHWFRFVNAVAREVAKTHPAKRISTLAYWSHEGVPTGFDLEPNVTVWFCLYDSQMPQRKDYAGQIARLKEWRARHPKMPLGVWLYNTFPYEYAAKENVKIFPAFCPHAAARQWRLFKALDMRDGVFECGTPGTLASYLQLKLMDDPDRDLDGLVGEYCSLYGAAAPAIRRFVDLCEKAYLGSPGWRWTADAVTLAALADCIAEAERTVDTPQAQGALALFKLDVWDYICAGAGGRVDAFESDATAPRRNAATDETPLL